MRKVFSSHAEVAKVWARRSQVEGRAGNIYFRGATIYSYGHHFPIARIEGNTCLFTTRSYSNSTAKHKGIVSRFIPSYCKVISVDDILDSAVSGVDRGFNAVQGENVSRMVVEIETLKGKAKRARQNKEYYLGWVADKENNLAEYCELRGVTVPKNEPEQGDLFN